MARRLFFGPILIAFLLLLLWADEALTGVRLPPQLGALTTKDGYAAPGLVLLLVGALICARAAIELARMFKAAGMIASRRVVVFAAIAGVLAGGLTIGTPGKAALGMHTGASLATAATLVVVLALLVHTRHQTVKGACGAVGAALTAFAYAGVMLGFVMALRVEFGVWAVLAVILTAKSCDIGAYFTGTAIGRHKLIPWLSPGKTWEGLVGGLITSGVVAAGLASATPIPHVLDGLRVHPGLGFAFGAALGLVAQGGDLSASVLKRDAGIKDSGRILPGFGGVIDVVDSLVLAGPFAFWFLMMVRGSG